MDEPQTELNLLKYVPKWYTLSQKETKIMTQREILLEMYEKLWNADKDKWAWNAILKDTLEKTEKCKHIKREGESCRLNNNCRYPNCTH